MSETLTTIIKSSTFEIQLCSNQFKTTTTTLQTILHHAMKDESNTLYIKRQKNLCWILIDYSFPVLFSHRGFERFWCVTEYCAGQHNRIFKRYGKYFKTGLIKYLFFTMHGVHQIKHCRNGQNMLCIDHLAWMRLYGVTYLYNVTPTKHVPNVLYNQHFGFFSCNSQIQMIHSNSLMKQDKLV